MFGWSAGIQEAEGEGQETWYCAGSCKSEKLVNGEERKQKMKGVKKSERKERELGERRIDNCMYDSLEEIERERKRVKKVLIFLLI